MDLVGLQKKACGWKEVVCELYIRHCLAAVVKYHKCSNLEELIFPQSSRGLGVHRGRETQQQMAGMVTRSGS